MLRASSSIIIRSAAQQQYKRDVLSLNSQQHINISRVYFSSTPRNQDKRHKKSSFVRSVSAGLPDWIEHWSRDTFRQLGYALALTVPAAAMTGSPAMTFGAATTTAV